VRYKDFRVHVVVVGVSCAKYPKVCRGSLLSSSWACRVFYPTLSSRSIDKPIYKDPPKVE
jgi:hypothetical protein